MEVIYLLIPLSLVFLVLAIWFFLWAMKAEQYEDLEGPAHRIIIDDREAQHRQAQANLAHEQSKTTHDDKHHD